MLRVSPCYVKFLNKLRKLSNKIFSKGKPVARIVTSWERVVPAKNRQAHSNSEVRETGSDLLVRRHFRTKMKVKVKRECFKIFCYKIHTLFIPFLYVMFLKTILIFSLTLISLFITRNVLLDLTMTTIYCCIYVLQRVSTINFLLTSFGC